LLLKNSAASVTCSKYVIESFKPESIPL